MKVVYLEKEVADLNLIEPLWYKLLEHHRIRSKHFTDHFLKMIWTNRKAGLLEKSASGHLRVDIARDSEKGLIVGYCVSTVSAIGQGEIESIFVEPEYRKVGIGDGLMQRARELSFWNR
jgi:diamine N-acetyltransferase